MFEAFDGLESETLALCLFEAKEKHTKEERYSTSALAPCGLPPSPTSSTYL